MMGFHSRPGVNRDVPEITSSLKQRRLSYFAPAALASALGLGTYYSSYYAGPEANPVFGAYSVALFYIGLLMLLGVTLLREPLAYILGARKRRTGLGVLLLYLPVHLIVYGLLLEELLASVYGYPGGVKAPEVYLSYSPVYPVNAINALLGLAVTPSISIALPPYLGIDLAAYSVAMALVIGVLVAGNVQVVMGLGSACSSRRKKATFIGLPALGLVSGASCCLSLPILLDLAVPAAGVVLLSSPASYIAYLVFPPATAVALAANFKAALRIRARLTNRKYLGAR